MKRNKKLLAVVLSAATAITMLLPTAAFADTAWDYPTEAMSVDNSIAKVGIHAAASTTSFFLGGNVVAERSSDYRSITSATTPYHKLQAAMEFTRLGAFGTTSNTNPDPYLWNYFYNLAVDATAATGAKTDDEVYISTVGSPMASDTTIVDSLGTSYTLARRPEVLMDTAGGYDSLIAQLPENTDSDTSNDYSPISLSYKANNFADFVSDMYNLADAMNESGKDGRYGDPYDIAVNYEEYMKGLQLYLIANINWGVVDKKSVAVVDTTATMDTDEDGTPDAYKLVDNSVSIGTSTDRPSEALKYISNNMRTDESVADKLITSGSDVYAKASDIVEYADAIIQAGHGSSTEDQIRAALKTAGATDEKADTVLIYASDPSDVFSIRANSVENFANVATMGGYLYPELLDTVDAFMYVYQNFWHLKDSELAEFANANFANASLSVNADRDGSDYSEAEIENDIEIGLQYYANHADEFEGTTLEMTDNIDLPDAQTSLENATVTVANAAYTGKEVEPKVTVVCNGKTLVEDTDYYVTYENNTEVGTGHACVWALSDDYCDVAHVDFTIAKAAQPMKVTAKKATIKVKKSAKVLTVKKAQGTVTYKKTSGNKKITVNTKTGKVTVKKGAKKGTYKIKVKVTAKGNANYKAGTKTVTATIKVK